MRSIFFLNALLSILFIFSLQIVKADTTRRVPSNDGIFTAGPYYNPSSKSYFELINLSPTTWQDASQQASHLKYKGTYGRLATISDTKTHLFLLKNFIFLEDTWLGLQFLCNGPELKWSNGTSPRQNNFSSWTASVNAADFSCSNNDFLPVYIKSGTFNWEMAQANKTSHYILVEYPTGRK